MDVGGVCNYGREKEDQRSENNFKSSDDCGYSGFTVFLLQCSDSRASYDADIIFGEYDLAAFHDHIGSAVGGYEADKFDQ